MLMGFIRQSIKDQKDKYLEWLATIPNVWVEKMKSVLFRKEKSRIVDTC